ncbi:NADP-dependent isocitrate dehydrogenase [Campylobacter sp. VicNov18]|uniref:NADP-dependent isocitrate dehydrogenase n=1 Tax=Campylobacter bilis TaxID=2691918 RepID=UPI00130DDDA9|nr:NADP-dependent isocitrate dehydrogenase [Campylobacter bilis]MPV64136.1 NADP-dependent isocitrate dehydrogenase [Campylobacter hepaticus]MBM0637639.1 NADP-dependent isocitrate dehydrogenase [Campylobacter bilis]MCC8278365.1 NADP-dependent isocitrate dehydrogenase [Campylobacter bilis]MCC8299868.1 NADP-dependent isocitrate dehydrogenase [Campylobacter bilis]MCC8301274.1 NADP-dependent isocitrate dehydrogenase [Campylobacter bilis]
MQITYTLTDESPALATYSFLPIIKAFLARAHIGVKISDISLSARILANFSEYLKPEQRCEDALEFLGELVKKPDANLIKTPNISASIPQLKAAIKELQDKGYMLPNYPDEPKNDEELQIKTKYQKVLGSAVNPVLRQGNSDRRCTKAVKDYARNNPYKIIEFHPESKTRISYMKEGDFFSNEKAILLDKDCLVNVEFLANSGKSEILKEGLKLEKNEILDASFMDVEKLQEFYAKEIQASKEDDVLFSLHLKATMMKVSDPILFGYAVKVFFKELFEEFKDEFQALNINPNNGLSELLTKIEASDKKEEILKKYNAILAKSADIAMVNSDKGITNLHVPSDVIVDASIPAMLKNGAKLWDKEGKAKDTNALIPDQTYASIYEAVIEDLHKNGTLNPAKLGSVSNVGLMAKKAQEYGSHDKTFVAKEDGVFKIVCEDKVLLEHRVKKGDIYRVNETKIDAVLNWIDLGIQRADITGSEAIFWLDSKRASNKIMIALVQNRLKEKGKDIAILSPKQACLRSLELIRAGKDTISITGNVLRDYLTDLFPILELGTSAKMLSIVPMLNGGAMFETGAGGSAPKQVEQLVEENHLRWDSLGEFLALQASLEFYAHKCKNFKAKVLAQCLDEAIGEWLENNKTPTRKVKEDDNRTSHFYLALYFANHLARQANDMELQSFFKDIALELSSNEEKIRTEFNDTQGVKVDLGGYYKFDEQKVNKIMRPSATFNAILEKIG